MPNQTASITSKTHWVNRDGVLLHLWEKRVGKKSTSSVILLVHGGTLSSPTVFDIQTRAKDASLMDYLAKRGCDVFALTLWGYGRSERPTHGFAVTSATALRDIDAAVTYISALRGVPSISLLGWSWGANLLSLYAMEKPSRVKGIMLFAGGLSGPPVTPRPVPSNDWNNTTREGLLGRIEQDVVISNAQEALIKSALKWDPKTTNGPAKEIFSGQAPIAVPERIDIPTLMIWGARDYTYEPQRVANFFARLKTNDKALVILPGAGHFALIQQPRMRLFSAVSSFLKGE